MNNEPRTILETLKITPFNPVTVSNATVVQASV